EELRDLVQRCRHIVRAEWLNDRRTVGEGYWPLGVRQAHDAGIQHPAAEGLRGCRTGVSPVPEESPQIRVTDRRRRKPAGFQGHGLTWLAHGLASGVGLHMRLARVVLLASGEGVLPGDAAIQEAIRAER